MADGNDKKNLQKKPVERSMDILYATPDNKDIRNSTKESKDAAISANPDLHDGSAGGSQEHESITIVAVTETGMQIIASRKTGGSETEYLSRKDTPSMQEMAAIPDPAMQAVLEIRRNLRRSMPSSNERDRIEEIH